MERLIFRYILRFYEWEVMIYGNNIEIIYVIGDR
jgi:hypothetical protein